MFSTQKTDVSPFFCVRMNTKNRCLPLLLCQNEQNVTKCIFECNNDPFCGNNSVHILQRYPVNAVNYCTLIFWAKVNTRFHKYFHYNAIDKVEYSIFISIFIYNIYFSPLIISTLCFYLFLLDSSQYMHVHVEKLQN